VLQPAAWIPLVDTNEQNGCLRLVKGGHRSGKTATHTCCVGGTWYIDLDPDVCARTLGCDMRPVEEGEWAPSVPIDPDPYNTDLYLSHSTLVHPTTKVVMW
jgi:hypothetical protein